MDIYCLKFISKRKKNVFLINIFLPLNKKINLALDQIREYIFSNFHLLILTYESHSRVSLNLAKSKYFSKLEDRSHSTMLNTDELLNYLLLWFIKTDSKFQPLVRYPDNIHVINI